MRSIRFVFSVVLLGLVGFFTYSQYRAYRDIYDEIETGLVHFNNVFCSATVAKLHEVELVLDLLANQLLLDQTYKDSAKTSKILTQIMNRLGATVGVGLVSPEGYYLALSSSIDINKVKGLHEQDETKESFARTLVSDTMVAGRVYFFKASQRWVLPVRKAFHDASGKLIGVVTTGLLLDENTSFMDRSIMFYPGQYSEIVSEPGLWRVFVHNLGLDDFSRVYLYPMPKSVQHDINRVIEKKYKLPVSSLHDGSNSFSYIGKSDILDKKVIGAIRHINRYDMWSISVVPYDSVVQIFLERGFFPRLLAFSFSTIVIVILFVYVLRREERTKKDLDYRAHHDPLTGLSNRFALTKISDDWTKVNAAPFDLLFMDLDNFKNINDAFGHSCGDTILAEVATRLRSIVPEGARLVRHGGDEFAVFVPSDKSRSVEKLAANLVDGVSERYLVSGMSLHIGASVGIACFPQDGIHLDQLMIAADLAMRVAKRKKNSFSFYNRDLSEDMRRKVGIEYNLRHALDKDEIYMAFQPQIACDGRIHGVEALVRWESPELGFVAPDQFVAVAEETGLIGRLGGFIASQSCAEFAQVLRECGDAAAHMTLSINISVKQFLEDNFKERLLEIIRQNDLEPSQVTIEITESLFIDEPEIILPLLHDIRKSGVKVSLDDFGTGYSSLSTLRTLPIDELKVDKEFIGSICHVEQDAKMTRSIIDMGHTMGMQVVSEGVEDNDQVQLLRDNDCDIFQGYYFSHPLRKPDLIEFVKTYSEASPKPGLA